MRLNATTAATLGFGVCLVFAGLGVSPAATTHAAKKPVATGGSTALVAQGKTLAVKDRCNGCHSPNYAGKKGFSPSLHASGVLHEYNAKTWARVMNTGLTNDGGKVKPPMPVYHLPAKSSAALYAFFKTLK